MISLDIISTSITRKVLIGGSVLLVEMLGIRECLSGLDCGWYDHLIQEKKNGGEVAKERSS